MIVPPHEAVAAAIEAGRASPCAKSKRGVSIFARHPGPNVVVYARAHNSPPEPFDCDGSAACKNACRAICEHAEAAALRLLGGVHAAGRGLELLHIKVVDGKPVVSGPPSCPRCSLAILADRRISTVWLLHAEGWRSYTPEAFHGRSLRAVGLPVIRGQG